MVFIKETTFKNGIHAKTTDEQIIMSVSLGLILIKKSFTLLTISCNLLSK